MITTQKIHLIKIQNMQKMKRNGKIDERITLRIKVLESKIDRFRSLTKQSIERNTVVASVVYFTGLKMDVILVGSLKFIDMETDTI